MASGSEFVRSPPEHCDRLDHMMGFMHIARRRMLEAFAEGYKLKVMLKPDSSKYTNVDLEINDLFIDYIHNEFPEDAVLGEECIFKPADFNPEKHWTWLIDPVDGTGGFVKAVEKGDVRDCTSSVMITAFAPGQTAPAMSVVYSPFEEGGLYVNHDYQEQRTEKLPQVFLHNIDPWPLCEQPIGDIEEFLTSIQTKKVSSIGIAAGRIAVGELDLCVFPGPDSNPHDYVPAMHIAQANSTVWVTNLEGKKPGEINMLKPTNGLILASNKELGARVLQIVRREKII